MTSIERTAYPRFKRLITARELHLFFSPSREELVWCQERADSEDHQLSLLLLLKSHQRMARFPKWDEIPEMVVDFVRKAVELPEGSVPGQYASVRTAEAHRSLVRGRVEGVRFDAAGARQVAEGVIRAEAASKNTPADLINVALEQLVQKGLELPGFSTLDRMAMSIRAEVNSAIFTLVAERIGEEERAGQVRLVTTLGLDRKTMFNQLKKSAQRATWSNMRKLSDHRTWVDGLGDTGAWLGRIGGGEGRGLRWRGGGCGRGRDAGLRRGQADHADDVSGPQGTDAGARRPDDDVLQAGRRDLGPLRAARRHRVPPHRRHLHRAVHPLHPVRGVGGGVHHRGAWPRCRPT